jgi:hypothetical protein
MKRQSNKINNVTIVSKEEANKIWDESWEEYLKLIKEQKLDDPKRIPTSEFMHRHCVI